MREGRGKRVLGRHADGRYSRIWEPKVKRQVIVVEGVAIPDPFIEWMQSTVSADLRYDLAPPYDRDAVAMVQTMQGNRISRKGIAGLIERICPYLDPMRKRLLLERMDSLLMHRKSKLDREEARSLEAQAHAARRWTKAERRQKRKAEARDARKELKRLLSK